MARHRTTSVLAAVLAHLLTSVTHGSAVLCIGEDGHVAIESPSAACCAAEAEPAEGPIAAADAEVWDGCRVHRCCRCLDLPLPPNLGLKLVRASGAVSSAFEAALIPSLLSAPPAPAGLASPTLPPPRIGGAPRAGPPAVILPRLRTAILRC